MSAYTYVFDSLVSVLQNSSLHFLSLLSFSYNWTQRQGKRKTHTLEHLRPKSCEHHK